MKLLPRPGGNWTFLKKLYHQPVVIFNSDTLFVKLAYTYLVPKITHKIKNAYPF